MKEKKKGVLETELNSLDRKIDNINHKFDQEMKKLEVEKAKVEKEESTVTKKKVSFHLSFLLNPLQTQLRNIMSEWEPQLLELQNRQTDYETVLSFLRTELTQTSIAKKELETRKEEYSKKYKERKEELKYTTGEESNLSRYAHPAPNTTCQLISFIVCVNGLYLQRVILVLSHQKC